MAKNINQHNAMNKKIQKNKFSAGDQYDSSIDWKILIENSSRTTYDSVNNEYKPSYGEEKNLVQELYVIQKLIKKLLEGTKDEFYVNQPLKSTAKLELKKSPLGERLLSHIRCCAEDYEEWLPLHKINPYAQLYLRHFSNSHGFLSFPSLTDQVHELNRRVDAIRKEAATADFKRKIKTIQKNSNDNYISLNKYFSGLFSHHARLLVLRLDLSYNEEEAQRQYVRIGSERRKKNNTSPVTLSKSNDISAATAIDPVGNNENLGFSIYEILKHREQFIKYLNKTFKSSMRGYAWKLEHGKLKGYHYHLIIMLDGSRVRKDSSIAILLGEHWRTEITKNRGVYYNCNARKESYRYCAVGMQSHDTPDLEHGLSMVARYMTKPDLYVQLQLPNGRRTLGRGVLPKLVVPKRGRPRKKIAAPTTAEYFAGSSTEGSFTSAACNKITSSLPDETLVLVPPNADHNNREL